MKKHLLIAAILLAALSTYAQTDEDASTLTKVGQQAPAFTFQPDKNKTASIESYKGKIVMLNFFATWCPPCRLELPRVQKEIWEKYKNNPRFALMVFGREEGWDKVLPFKTANNYTFDILPDEGRKVFSLFAKQSIPRNVILDESGKIIYQSTGYSEQEFNKLLALLDSQLKKPLP